MEFEDGLIIGVALVIGLNRAFIGTGLKHSRAAYVFVQAFDIGACVALFFAKIFPDIRLDYAIRVFLMLFVAWHMVQNSVTRAALRRPSSDETRELAEARAQIEATIAREREEEEAEREAARLAAAESAAVESAASE